MADSFKAASISSPALSCASSTCAHAPFLKRLHYTRESVRTATAAHGGGGGGGGKKSKKLKKAKHFDLVEYKQMPAADPYDEDEDGGYCIDWDFDGGELMVLLPGASYRSTSLFGQHWLRGDALVVGAGARGATIFSDQEDGAAVLMQPVGVDLQAYTGVLVVVSSFALHLVTLPFVDDHLDALESAALYTQFATLSVGLFLFSPNTGIISRQQVSLCRLVDKVRDVQ